MKKLSYILSIAAFFCFLTAAPSCAPKYGCEINQEAHVQLNKKKSSKKRGKSQLFPKHMRGN
jgi:hypothetical protein